MESQWRRCSICKKELDFGQTYWVCNVSTCNRKRTGLVFCSVECWDAHLPSMRHRESWAEERTAPGRGDWERERDAARNPVAATRRPPATRPATASRNASEGRATVVALRKAASGGTAGEVAQEGALPPLRLSDDVADEILVVVSKLKGYISARAEMKTSDAVMGVLSERLRHICDEAIHRAHAAGRKTVLDRDFSD